MPVIQLPKDTRWGDLGTGLGQVIGGALEGYANKQADQSVAQIMEDPLLTEPAKLTKIMKEVPNGLERYKGLVTSQVLQATVKEKTAEAAKNQAAADQAGGQSDLIRMLNGLPPKAAAPTTSVLPQAPAPVTPVAPVASAAPAATAASVIPDVLAGGSTGAAAPAAAPAAEAAPTTSPSPTVSALTGAPTPGATPIERMIDERAAMSGVTFTPAERANLVVITNGHLSQKAGLGEAMAPVDAAIKMKVGGAKLPSELDKAQSEAATAAAGARTAVAKGAADLAEQQARLEETTAKGESARQVAAAGRPVEVDLPKLQANFPTFSPEQQQAVSVAGRAGGLTKRSAGSSKITRRALGYRRSRSSLRVTRRRMERSLSDSQMR